jgi:hypothetical protein
MSFLDFLVDKEIIHKKDIPAVKGEMEASHISIYEVLTKHGIAPQTLLELKSEFYKIPLRSINDQTVPFDVLKYVPEESALHYKFVPIGVKDGMLEVGILDPDSIDARDALNFISAKINMPMCYKYIKAYQVKLQKPLQN